MLSASFIGFKVFTFQKTASKTKPIRIQLYVYFVGSLKWLCIAPIIGIIRIIFITLICYALFIAIVYRINFTQLVFLDWSNFAFMIVLLFRRKMVFQSIVHMFKFEREKCWRTKETLTFPKWIYFSSVLSLYLHFCDYILRRKHCDMFWMWFGVASYIHDFYTQSNLRTLLEILYIGEKFCHEKFV